MSKTCQKQKLSKTCQKQNCKRHIKNKLSKTSKWKLSKTCQKHVKNSCQNHVKIEIVTIVKRLKRAKEQKNKQDCQKHMKNEIVKNTKNKIVKSLWKTKSYARNKMAAAVEPCNGLGDPFNWAMWSELLLLNGNWVTRLWGLEFKNIHTWKCLYLFPTTTSQPIFVSLRPNSLVVWQKIYDKLRTKLK